MKKLWQILYDNIGQEARIYCQVAKHIYQGVIADVNDSALKLENASALLERGAFNDPAWMAALRLPTGDDGHWYIQVDCIESFGMLEG